MPDVINIIIFAYQKEMKMIFTITTTTTGSALSP